MPPQPARHMLIFRFSLSSPCAEPPLGSVTLPMSGPQDLQQLADVAGSVTQPVAKAEQLASALWNLDRIDQRAPPLVERIVLPPPGGIYLDRRALAPLPGGDTSV